VQKGYVCAGSFGRAAGAEGASVLRVNLRQRSAEGELNPSSGTEGQRACEGVLCAGVVWSGGRSARASVLR
jgi:hypothetical protein